MKTKVERGMDFTGDDLLETQLHLTREQQDNVEVQKLLNFVRQETGVGIEDYKRFLTKHNLPIPYHLKRDVNAKTIAGIAQATRRFKDGRRRSSMGARSSAAALASQVGAAGGSMQHAGETPTGGTPRGERKDRVSLVSGFLDNSPRTSGAIGAVDSEVDAGSQARATLPTQA